MREIYALEISSATGLDVRAASISEASANPHLARTRLVAVLPQHERIVRAALPIPEIAVLRISNLETVIRSLKSGGPLRSVGVVSKSPMLLAFASPLLHAALDSKIGVETALLSDVAAVRDLIHSVDWVLADVVAADPIRDRVSTRLLVLSLLDPSTFKGWSTRSKRGPSRPLEPGHGL